uniref:HMA domain-containing protein n=1 Tax=Anthurium amnicola TaxID=1678845 RepID=A0A1D1XIT1_9ARAE
MGEVEGGKGDDGQKKKAEGGGDKKKKDDGPITVVLKVDMHCEGCARKVKRSVKGFEGVEAAWADCPNGKLTVVGKVDPWKLRDRVESKTHKKAVLVSPTNVPKKDAAAKDEKKAEEKKPVDKKPKEPAVSTVVLKIRLHCEGCIQRIRRVIIKIKGVETVSLNPKEDLVTIKGTMDMKTLPDYLKARLKRSVAVVPQQKKDEGEGTTKEKGNKGGDKKKGGGGGDGGAEKKGNGNGGGGGEKKKDEGGAKMVWDANKMEYHGYGGFGGDPPYGYRFELIPAPQLFSDENPNACSVM